MPFTVISDDLAWSSDTSTNRVFENSSSMEGLLSPAKFQAIFQLMQIFDVFLPLRGLFDLPEDNHSPEYQKEYDALYSFFSTPIPRREDIGQSSNLEEEKKELMLENYRLLYFLHSMVGLNVEYEYVLTPDCSNDACSPDEASAETIKCLFDLKIQMLISSLKQQPFSKVYKYAIAESLSLICTDDKVAKKEIQSRIMEENWDGIIIAPKQVAQIIAQLIKSTALDDEKKARICYQAADIDIDKPAWNYFLLQSAEGQLFVRLIVYCISSFELPQQKVELIAGLYEHLLTDEEFEYVIDPYPKLDALIKKVGISYSSIAEVAPLVYLKKIKKVCEPDQIAELNDFTRRLVQNNEESWKEWKLLTKHVPCACYYLLIRASQPDQKDLLDALASLLIQRDPLDNKAIITTLMLGRDYERNMPICLSLISQLPKVFLSLLKRIGTSEYAELFSVMKNGISEIISLDRAVFSNGVGNGNKVKTIGTILTALSLILGYEREKLKRSPAKQLVQNSAIFHSSMQQSFNFIALKMKVIDTNNFGALADFARFLAGQNNHQGRPFLFYEFECFLYVLKRIEEEKIRIAPLLNWLKTIVLTLTKVDYKHHADG